MLEEADEKALILLPDENQAISFHKAISSVFPRALFFPARDFSLVRVDSAGRDFSVQRLYALSRIAEGDFDCVVTTFEAACQATMPPEVMIRHRTKLSVGDEISKEKILSLLSDAGYLSSHRVEGKGQFAARGDLIDVFLPSEESPVRIELFGDEIDAMGYFDITTQRRVENVQTITLSPAEEIFFSESDRETAAGFLREEKEKTLPEEKEKRVFIRSLLERMENKMDFAKDLFLPLVYRFSTLFDYFREGLIFLYGQSEAAESLKTCNRLLEEEIRALFLENKTILPPEDLKLLLDFDAFSEILSHRKTLLMENFFVGKSPISPSGIYSFVTRTSPRSFRDLEGLAEEITSLHEEGYKTILLSENSLSASHLEHFFEEKKIPARFCSEGETEIPQNTVFLVPSSEQGASLIRGGFELSDSRIALLCDSASPATVAKKRRRAHSSGKGAKEKIFSYQDLAVGDYVVHQGHGIGIFRGVEKMKSADGSKKDFIKISYAGSDVLYVPCANLDSVSKYIGKGSDDETLKLNRLGGADWQKAKSRAKAGAKDIAKKLIKIEQKLADDIRGYL